MEHGFLRLLVFLPGMVSALIFWGFMSQSHFGNLVILLVGLVLLGGCLSQWSSWGNLDLGSRIGIVLCGGSAILAIRGAVRSLWNKQK